MNLSKHSHIFATRLSYVLDSTSWKQIVNEQPSFYKKKHAKLSS